MAKTHSSIKAAGGINTKVYHCKCGTAAGSVAITGIAATDYLQSCYGARFSQAATGICFVKTVGDLTTACTLGTNKIVLAAIKALSNSLITVVVHTPV